MSVRTFWRYLFKTLILVSVSTAVGYLSYGFTWGAGAIGIALIPALLFSIAFLSLVFKRDKEKRKEGLAGVLLSLILWLIFYGYLAFTPSRHKWVFLSAIPQLEKFERERQGNKLAAALNGTLGGVDLRNHFPYRIYLKDNQGYYMAETNGTVYAYSSITEFYPKLDSTLLIQKLSLLINPFLNSEGHKAVKNSRWKTRIRPRYAGLTLLENEKVVLNAEITDEGQYQLLFFEVMKDYSIVNH